MLIAKILRKLYLTRIDFSSEEDYSTTVVVELFQKLYSYIGVTGFSIANCITQLLEITQVAKARKDAVEFQV